MKGLDDTHAPTGVFLTGYCCCRYHDVRRKYNDDGERILHHVLRNNNY